MYMYAITDHESLQQTLLKTKFYSIFISWYYMALQKLGCTRNTGVVIPQQRVPFNANCSDGIFWKIGEVLEDTWHGLEVPRMVTKFKSLQVHTHSNGHEHCKQQQVVQYVVLEGNCKCN